MGWNIMQVLFIWNATKTGNAVLPTNNEEIAMTPSAHTNPEDLGAMKSRAFEPQVRKYISPYSPKSEAIISSSNTFCEREGLKQVSRSNPKGRFIQAGGWPSRARKGLKQAARSNPEGWFSRPDSRPSCARAKVGKKVSFRAKQKGKKYV